MSDEGTPPDHTVLAITIEPQLLPEWFEALRDVVTDHARRMAVIEKPDSWICRIEIQKDRVPGFSDALGEAWQVFVAERKAQGNWEAEE